LVRIVEADIPPFREAEFNTPEAAIAHGQAMARRPWLVELRDRTSGRRIVDMSWDDASLTVHLDSEESLRFAWEHDELRVGMAEPSQRLPPGRRPPDDDPILIKVAGNETLWNPADMAAKVIGKEIYAISIGNEVASLAFRGGLEIFIATLVNRETGQRFVMWSPL
jgi:hypothetical protein